MQLRIICTSIMMISSFHKCALWASCTAGSSLGSFCHPSWRLCGNIPADVRILTYPNNHTILGVTEISFLLSSDVWCKLQPTFMTTQAGWMRWGAATWMSDEISITRQLNIEEVRECAELNAVYGTSYKTTMKWAPLHLLSNFESNVYGFTVVMMMLMTDISSRNFCLLMAWFLRSPTRGHIVRLSCEIWFACWGGAWQADSSRNVLTSAWSPHSGFLSSMNAVRSRVPSDTFCISFHLVSTATRSFCCGHVCLLSTLKTTRNSH